jgi:hypothetical protein
MVNVAIFGTGRLGTLLSQELIRADKIGTIYLSRRSRHRLEGICLSLSVFGSVVRSKTRIKPFVPKNLGSVDLVVIAIKDNYDPRELITEERFPSWYPVNVRTVGLRRDLPLLMDVCSLLKRFRGKIAVLTNPVDIVTGMVTAWCPEANVVGLGASVDSARIAYRLSTMGVECDYRELLVVGEHGNKLIPVRRSWPETVLQRVGSSASLRGLLSAAEAIGPAIVNGIGYTSHDCAFVFSRDVLALTGCDARERWIVGSHGAPYRCIGKPFLAGLRRIKTSVPRLSPKEHTALGIAEGEVYALMQRIRRSPAFEAIKIMGNVGNAGL